MPSFKLDTKPNLLVTALTKLSILSCLGTKTNSRTLWIACPIEETILPIASQILATASQIAWIILPIKSPKPVKKPTIAFHKFSIARPILSKIEPPSFKE